MADLDPYRILGVAAQADQQTIRAAYRTLARRYHPDRAQGADDLRRMVEINAAWEILREPARRIAYDQARARIVRKTADGGEVIWRMDSDGTGHGGPPPGRPAGSILPFGRYIAWSLGEVARTDPGYLLWLEERREGKPYRDEIDELLRPAEIRTPGAPKRRR